MSPCDRITLLLAEDGPSALRDDAQGQDHVAGCDACYELLLGLQELEDDLAALPEMPVDPALRARVVADNRISSPGSLLPAEPEVEEPEPRAEEEAADVSPEAEAVEDEIELDDPLEPLDEPEIDPSPPRRSPVLRFVRRHPRKLIAAAALLLLMVSTTPVLLLTFSRGGADYSLSDTPDRFVQLMIPGAEQPPAASYDAPEPAVAAEVAEEDAVADLLSDGDYGHFDGAAASGGMAQPTPALVPVESATAEPSDGIYMREPGRSRSSSAGRPGVRRLETREDRQSRLEEETSETGLLAVLGTTSSSPERPVADLLGDSDQLGRDVGEALAGSSGLQVARSDAGYRGEDEDKDGERAAPEKAPHPEPEPTPEPLRDRRVSERSVEKADVDDETVTLAREKKKEEEREVTRGPNGSYEGFWEDSEVAELDGRGLRGIEGEGKALDNGRWTTAVTPPVDPSAAQQYIADNQATDGVRFQRASGYWENRYVPGDPTLRRLHRRLTESDRTELGLPDAETMMLDAAARQYSQPFDRPADSALAVYLHGDRRGVQGETRMRLQVGIQATERGSGRRTAMNVGVVLDLRQEPDAEDAAAIRSLLEALSQARESGDTISLTVAGKPGGMILPPGDFRYGPVTVALEELLSEGPPPDGTLGGGPLLTLPMALHTAAVSVQSIDDPSQPLGSSLVLLVSAGRLNGASRRLASIAHSSAVAGVPVSVVGVGDGADLPHLEEIALAGQGNRRLLNSPGDARDLVDRELTAVSHVVARAVRLRIKLAPGVKLVDVLGSDRLDAMRSERVREAERSIDLRLSKNLGIEADRGEDEEGIQIVVPTWYSGDAHVVLLDVVVPGPGPVAEVTVRYKDLVHLRNGVARSSLRLTHDSSPPGPLEHNVVRNVLAMELSDVLADASRLLSNGRETDAASTLRQFVELVRGLQLEEPVLYGDPEVDADLEMVSEYLALLEGTGSAAEAPMAAPAARAYVRDSLEYASFNKINPRIQSELE